MNMLFAYNKINIYFLLEFTIAKLFVYVMVDTTKLLKLYKVL